MSRSRFFCLICLPLVAALTLLGQTDRIQGRIVTSVPVELRGNISPRAQAKFDRGPADPALALPDMALILKPSLQQHADLQQLLVEQQDRSSVNYHRWLSPEEFADRFAVTQTDLQKVRDWLVAEGFQISYQARARNWIAFSGTVRQVEKTFRTSIRRYSVGGENHYANATEPFVPSALSGVVAVVRGLDDFREKPLLRRPSVSRSVRPAYTDGSGNHYLAPDDIATIYDLAPLYAAGFDGTGQKIAIMGQTDITLSDIAAFRSIFNLSANVPQLTLYGRDPGLSKSDQQEAELDLEWSGAVARNATIIYVYSTAVFNSLTYAIDQNLAPVITLSYGSCESDNASTLDTYRTVAQQAASQGISWVNASGDSGAASCDSDTSSQATQGLAVLFPASIPEVTAAGGTEFNEGSGSYWNSANNSNQGSAKSYIPEMAWNDTARDGSLSATGGGVSDHYPTPAWQTGAGFPNDGHRDVPDIAMTASADHDGFIVCVANTNCPASWKSLGAGSGYSIFGGTSVASPVFAGILTLVNHYLTSKGLQATTGLGSANQTLYWLAQSNPSAFHDVTSGNNIVPCKIGTTNCTTGQFGYTAGTGYDQTTGLGSVDAYNLVTAWGAATYPQVTSISPATPGVNANSQTITVSGSGFQSGLTVSLISPSSVISSVASSSVTPGSFQAALTLNATGTWKLQAIDADGRPSNQLSFSVASGPSAPAVSAASSSAITGSSATLSDTVDPDGASTVVSFLYGTNSSLNGATSTAQQNIGSGTSNVVVTAGITGLTAGTTYYFQAVATNSVGTTKSAIVSFATTAAKLPVAATGVASSVTSSAATLGGSANPNGVDTKVWFEYSTSNSMTGAVSTAQQDIGAGSSLVAVTANVTGLSSSTTYYFQLWASNSNGTSQGAIVGFATGPSQLPAANTLPVSTTGSNTATLGASVNPNGLDTLVWFQYSTNSSMSGSIVMPQQDIGSGTVAVPVSASPTALAATTTYYFQVLASNSAGTTQGAILSFTTIAMQGSKIGIVRKDVFNFDSDGNEQGPAPADPLDRIDAFVPPGGVLAGDQPVVGDWTGDGKTKAGWFRPSTGQWWLDAANTGIYSLAGSYTYQFAGGPQDVGIIGDWVGLGRSAIGVVRSGFLWILDINADGAFEPPTSGNPITGDAVFAFGAAGDFPVVGNWYQKLSLGGFPISQAGMVRTYCNPTCTGGPFLWLLDSAVAGIPTNVTPQTGHAVGNLPGIAFGGGAGDIPVAGDWSNTGVMQFGDFRSGFLWVLDGGTPLAAQNSHFVGFSFAYGGIAGDVPIVGRW